MKSGSTGGCEASFPNILKRSLIDCLHVMYLWTEITPTPSQDIFKSSRYSHSSQSPKYKMIYQAEKLQNNYNSNTHNIIIKFFDQNQINLGNSKLHTTKFLIFNITKFHYVIYGFYYMQKRIILEKMC